jgi:hypothetical protein
MGLDDRDYAREEMDRRRRLAEGADVGSDDANVRLFNVLLVLAALLSLAVIGLVWGPDYSVAASEADFRDARIAELEAQVEVLTLGVEGAESAIKECEALLQGRPE